LPGHVHFLTFLVVTDGSDHGAKNRLFPRHLSTFNPWLEIFRPSVRHDLAHHLGARARRAEHGAPTALLRAYRRFAVARFLLGRLPSRLRSFGRHCT
jgi:hypothetical protein